MTKEFMMVARQAFETVEGAVMKAMVSKIFSLDGIDPDGGETHIADCRVGFSLIDEIQGHVNCDCVLCSDENRPTLSRLVVSLRMTVNGKLHGFMLDWGSCKLFCMDDETACDMREELVTAIAGFVFGKSPVTISQGEMAKEIICSKDDAFSRN